MKVAFVTTNLEADNGWGRYSLEILKRLPDLGVEPIVLMAYDAPSAGPNAHPALSSYADGLAKPLHIATDLWRAGRLLTDCRAVHCLAEPYMPVAHALAGDLPLHVTAVGTYAVSCFQTRWRGMYRRAYEQATTVSAISQYTASRLDQALPSVSPKVRVIPLGVDVPPALETAPGHAREDAFLMVGQVKARKGTLQAVEAMATVRERFPQARLYIAGAVDENAYVRLVKQRVAELGLEGHVIWLGRLNAATLDGYYHRVRGLVMPSMNAGAAFEGFGLVHLEANAFGVPAIGSSECGNEEAIQPGESGYLIEQGDVPALAEAMARLIDPAFDWDRMSRSALAFARRMRWERVAEAYAALYMKRADGL